MTRTGLPDEQLGRASRLCRAAAWLSALGISVTILSACGDSSTQAETPGKPELNAQPITLPEDFPEMPVPDDNVPSVARIALGRRLFYDVRLSRTEEVACANCHRQGQGFSDPDQFSLGVDGHRGTRNASSLVNMAYNTSFFWDGGARTLELQVIEPIRNELEMGSSLEQVETRLRQDPELTAEFESAYGEGPSQFTVPRALASFVRSLVSGNSAWDRFRRGDSGALDAAQQRGLELFNGERAECFHCHVGFNLTNNAFRNNGTRPDDPDIGREKVTSKASDRGKFKVPSLRNVAVTAPYMHDGSLATLDDVLDHYSQGGQGHPNTDPVMFRFDLTAQEKADIKAFLEALTDSDFLSDPRFSDPNLAR